MNCVTGYCIFYRMINRYANAPTDFVITKISPPSYPTPPSQNFPITNDPVLPSFKKAVRDFFALFYQFRCYACDIFRLEAFKLFDLFRRKIHLLISHIV